MERGKIKTIFLKRWQALLRSLSKFKNNAGQQAKKFSVSVKQLIPDKIGQKKFDPNKIQLKSFAKHTGVIEWALIILGVFLLANIAGSLISVWITPPSLPPPVATETTFHVNQQPLEDYNSILRRNMFNVEGKIPEPFDQGQLDCFSQARPTTARISLLGTIVMSDDQFSVALIQDENSQRVALKKDDSFGDGKYIALKIERKKLCFQVKSTQDFEYVEIPEEKIGGGSSPSLTSGSDGITPLSDSQFLVKNDFLQKNLLNLSEILQTAVAVPYIDPYTGNFRGFLVQTIYPGSIFSQLGIQQGDILIAAENIVFDNPGKGLEAFQQLRNAKKVSLKILRGGQEKTITYEVK